MSNKILSVFLCGFVLATQVSQSAMDFFSFLLIIWWVFEFRGSRIASLKSVMPPRPFVLFFVLWLLVVTLGYFFQSEIHWVQMGARILEFRWFFHLVVFAVCLNKLWLSKDIQDLHLQIFATIFSITSVYAISIFVLGFDPIHPDRILDTFPNGTIRTGGFLSQPIVFGHLMTLYFCFFVGLVLESWSLKKLRPYLVISCCLGLSAIILSFTRGAWIGLLAGIALMTFLRSKKIFFQVSCFFTAAFVSAYFLWKPFQERIHYAINGGDSERVYIWKANLLMFSEHPLLGVGYGRNTDLLAEYYQRIGAPVGLLIAHAHNQYINFLSGTGAFGLACYIFFLGYFLWLAWHIYKRQTDPVGRGMALGVLGAQVSFILGGLTESNFEHAKMKYVLALLWSMLLFLKTKNENQAENS